MTEITRPAGAIQRFTDTVQAASGTLGIPDADRAFLRDLGDLLSYTRRLEVLADPARLAREFNNGLEAAAQKADSWGREAGGGSGFGGEGYVNLAAAIRAMARQ